VERVIERDGQRLAVLDEGEGDAVVGLHGLSATRRYVLMGSNLVPRSGHRVVLFDARGHGRSSPAPGRNYSYAAMAADVEAVLDTLGIERAVLAGVSMGAHTAARMAIECPERVEGLLLVTPAFDPQAGDRRLRRWDALSAALRDGGIDGFVAALDLVRLPEGFRETVERSVRQRMDGHDDLQAVADALGLVPRSRPFESWAALAHIAAPAVVVGSRDGVDHEHPLATARRYAQEIPGARLVVEEPGRSPIAWQGGQLSRLLLALAQPDDGAVGGEPG
jgi:pimeloyl-ACP methyl ester carboxylesterase